MSGVKDACELARALALATCHLAGEARGPVPARTIANAARSKSAGFFVAHLALFSDELVVNCAP